MKKTKGKRDDRIRVACESLSAQLAGANSHATRYWFDRDGLGFLGFKVQGKGILSPMVPQQTAAAPIMVLRRDGEDLLLYREDGKTWWHDLYPPAGKLSERDTWPFRPEYIDKFGPLRAAKKKRAEQGGNSK